jgi:hypothetical protein
MKNVFIAITFLSNFAFAGPFQQWDCTSELGTQVTFQYHAESVTLQSIKFNGTPNYNVLAVSMSAGSPVVILKDFPSEGKTTVMMPGESKYTVNGGIPQKFKNCTYTPSDDERARMLEETNKF